MTITINVREKTTVKPAEKTPSGALWLSNLDLITKPGHNPSFYIYRPSGGADDPNFFNAVLLKEALSKVLVPFYPMAGRFKLDDSGRLEVDCNGEGVLFVEADTTAVVDDLGDFTPTPELRSLLVPTVDRSAGISSFPFLVLQVTYFKCGGVSLGVAIDHHIVDGFSGVHFINSWSETTRGLELTFQPFLDRTLLRACNPPQLVFDRIEYQSPHDQEMKASQENSKSQCATESITVANFEITKEQLNILKAKANDASVHEDGNTIRYSTFHVLAAHIWKCACIARGIRDDQECRLYFAVSGRNSRLQPPLPMGYFGNAFCRAVSVVVAGDLKSKPIWYSASSIHETLARMDSDYLRSTIDYLELQSDILAARYGPHLHMSPNLTITSWVRFSGHDTDFGWGQPLYIGPGDLTEGKSYIFGDARKDGSLRVATALQSSHMEVFKELFFKDCKMSTTTFFQ